MTRGPPFIRQAHPEISRAADDGDAFRWEPAPAADTGHRKGREMTSFETTIETRASAEQVMRVLTDPAEIRSWSPLPFEVNELDGETLATGSEARVSGSLAGLSVGFDVTVHAADEEGLRLTADGPVSFDVAYALRPSDAGNELSASVKLARPRGITRASSARPPRRCSAPARSSRPPAESRPAPRG